MLLEILLAFLSCGIILLCYWFLSGILLRPILDKHTITFYFASGSGDDLEHRCRSFRQYSSGGQLIIVDCGLSNEALVLAKRLEQKYAGVSLHFLDSP